jgi:RimJ/RimL family protein N-acetyltransferase
LLTATPSRDWLDEVEYRWPTAIDAPLAAEIVGLFNACIRSEDLLGFTEPLTSDAGRQVVGKLADAVRAGDKHLFAVQHRQQLIGMALLTPNSLPNCRHIVEWSKGIIRPDYQGQGLLRAAVHRMATRCVEMGWEIVTLDVRAGTRQERLWSRAGFREYGRLEDYARIQGSARAGVFMYARADRLMETSAPEARSLRKGRRC